jgi:hypothetical protein
MWAVRRGALRCCMGATVLAAAMAKELAAQEARFIRITPENVRFSNYLNDLAGPPALIGVAGGGLLHQVRQHDGTDGLAGEMASKLGQHAVQVSVSHGLAAVMHRSTDYQPCECRGFAPRVAHALLETFTDRRADGSRALSVPRMAGAYAGSFARLAWEPDRNVGDAAAGATLSLGFSALFNIARELTGVGR